MAISTNALRDLALYGYADPRDSVLEDVYYNARNDNWVRRVYQAPPLPAPPPPPPPPAQMPTPKHNKLLLLTGVPA